MSVFSALFEAADEACLILAASPSANLEAPSWGWQILDANAAFRSLAESSRKRSTHKATPAALEPVAQPEPVPPGAQALADLFGQPGTELLAEAAGSGRPTARVMQLQDRMEWYEASAIPLPYRSGRQPAIAVKLRDASRERIREAELKETQRELAREIVALNRLHALTMTVASQTSLPEVFEHILDAAIELAHTDKGSIQRADADGELTLVAHRGLGRDFCSQFHTNTADFGSCGKALSGRSRVLVDNVASSTLFAGTPGLAVLQAEGIVSINSTPLISRSGQIAGILNVFHTSRHEPSLRELRLIDLLACEAASAVERVRTAAALQESEQRALALVEELRAYDSGRTEFLSILSHELRNPLAAIMLGHSLLRQVPADSAQATQAFAILNRQTDHLARLVDDLLETTRISRGKVELRRERVELTGLISEAVTDFRALLDRKGTLLEIDLPAERIELFADPVRIVQIIGNLLSNAIKFTGQNDTVSVSVGLDARTAEAVIRIADTGAGIQPALLKNLFQPFVQDESTLDRSHGGLGLGLAIVDGMVRLHGGTVSAASDGPGKGSAFEVRLPLPDRPEPLPGQNADDRPAFASEQPVLARLRILVIEDNVDLADTLCALLEILGHEATAVHSGNEGIDCFMTFRPQVILCDIGLPGRNGYEVAQELRRAPNGHRVFMIALSGYAQSDDIDRALAAGFDRHLAKPVNMDILKETLIDGALLDRLRR